jgi:hypothetical protein
MKKLLIITNLFWVCVIVLPSFVQPGNLAPTGLNSTYHLIDASLVKLMAESYRDNYVNTYLKKQPSIIDKTNGKFNNVDSRTIWFSKEKLTQFINDMDAEAAQHNNQSVSGIRFYYIKYPDATNWSKYKYLTDPSMMPQNYKERHSLVLVPTYLDNNTHYHTDFDPRKVDATGKFKDMPTVMDELIKSEGTAIEPTQIQAFNLKNKEILVKPLPTLIKQLPVNTNYPGLHPFSEVKACMLSGDDSGSDLSVTNAGGIIPPYGVNGGAAFMIKKPGGGSLGQVSMNNIIDIPCSGATLMLYVDGLMRCGKFDRSDINIVVPKN